MTYLSQFPENALEIAPVASNSTGRSGLTARVRSMVKWIGDSIDTMMEYYAAATMYEQLSKLSDAELRRRGLSRHSLARDVFERRAL